LGARGLTVRGHIARKGKRYYVVVDVGRDPSTGRRRQKWHSGFRTRKEAERACIEILAQLDGGSYTTPTKATVADYLRQWLQGVRVDPGTLADYRMHVEKRLIPALGNLRAQVLTPLAIDALLRMLEREGGRRQQGLSPRSVRLVYLVGHKAYADGVRKGLLASNPFDKVDPPRVRRRAQKTWSAEELSRFLAQVRTTRLAAAWVLMATTGMRRGEVLGLASTAVDLDDGRLSVVQAWVIEEGKPSLKLYPKTDSGRRMLALDPDTIAALRAYRARQASERLVAGELWHNDRGFFFTREDGTPVHPDTFSEWFERQAQAAGLPRIRLHDLRHTYATLSLKAGVPSKVVSARLGHASTGITEDIYQHVTPQMQEEAAARVARLILGQ
jgi:integrase